MEACLEGALHELELALDHESKLDRSNCAKSVQNSKDMEHLVNSTREAVEHYTKACSKFMSVVPQLGTRSELNKKICANITYCMKRVTSLNTLMEALVKQVSDNSDSDEDLESFQEKSEEVRQLQQYQSANNSSKRYMVALEIRDSEVAYLDSLRRLKNVFILPLAGSSHGEVPILSKEMEKMIFGNIDEIIGLSETFLSEIRNRINNWFEDQTIGDIFLDYAALFKSYVLYTNGYEEGIAKLEELFENNPRAKAIQDLGKIGGTASISSLMITPIQRIPRYVLLIKELIKRTDPKHQDSVLLESALKAMESVAEHVDETLGNRENSKKILEIQSSLWKVRGVPSLLCPGRRFVLEGDMTKLRSNGLLVPVHVFLFNDILVYATFTFALPGRFHYRNQIEFYGISTADDEARRKSTFIWGKQCAFKITSPTAERIFIVDSLRQRDVWIDTIKKLIHEKARCKE